MRTYRSASQTTIRFHENLFFVNLVISRASKQLNTRLLNEKCGYKVYI